MRRRHRGGLGSLLVETLFDVGTSMAEYISDAQNEKMGLPSEHRKYMPSCSGGEMDFATYYQADLEKAKSMEEATAQEIRAGYVTGGDVEMSDLTTEGRIAPKQKGSGDYMDGI
jgi:hypothetical protein